MAKKKGGGSAEAPEASTVSPGPPSEPAQPHGADQGPPAEQRGSGPRKPTHKIRIGRIWATIWENHNPETGRWYSVTVTRSYQDGQGQWKSAGSFGRDDLLVVGEVCRLAFLWINEQFGHEGNGG
jgi:hypothetical protein